MRANAPITATLALAALSLLSAPLQARPTRLVRKSAAAEKTVFAEKARHSRHTAQPEHLRAPHAASHATPVSRHAHREMPEAPVRRARQQGGQQSEQRQVASSPTARRSRRTQQALRAESPVFMKPQPELVSSTANILPELYNRRGRLIMPAPLRGSREILLHQNLVADRDGLYRIQNDDDLDDMREHGLLVILPASNALEVDERLPFNRRYARPWAAGFLAVIAQAHYARFHTPLQVTSAVRTVEFQQHLIHINGNAAPADGDLASPHLTGQAIDIAKHGLSLTEIAWMRGYLLPLVQQGKVDVEEEFQQSCFHISVYKRYLPSPAPSRDIATLPSSGTEALATAIR